MATLIARLPTTPGSIRDHALRGLDRLPAPSPVVGRLLSRLAFKNVEMKELKGLIEKDVLLCGHVLRTVNSAAFARSSTITSLQQAMSLLGLGRLRRIAVGFAVGNLFPRVETPPSWSKQRFILHSGATALLTEAIVDSARLNNQDGAFVGGMLHDLGKLLIAVTLPQDYETIALRVQVNEQRAFECERETLGFDHAELSAIALLKWGLPEPVCQAVYYHHDPQSAAAPKLAMVIARADCFVNHLGITVLPPSAHDSEPPSLEIQGCEFDTLAVLQRFEREWLELAKFFE